MCGFDVLRLILEIAGYQYFGLMFEAVPMMTIARLEINSDF
jgi:hypothetical protein